MSYWNYRVIRKSHMESDTEVFEINEVHYNDQHQIEGWSTSPIAPMGEAVSELKGDIQLMWKAFEKPVLSEQRENNKEILVEAPEGGTEVR